MAQSTNYAHEMLRESKAKLKGLRELCRLINGSRAQADERIAYKNAMELEARIAAYLDQTEN